MRILTEISAHIKCGISKKVGTFWNNGFFVGLLWNVRGAFISWIVLALLLCFFCFDDCYRLGPNLLIYPEKPMVLS